MEISDFKLERYYAKYEFTSKYLLSSSDCDGYSLKYILSVANSEELLLWKNLKFGYTDSLGSEFLRKAISTHYKTIGISNINVMSPGEANFILMNILIEKGDEVICISPAYQSLYQVSKSLGANIKWWKFRNDGKYHIEDLENLITNKTKLLIINFPHNPTGYIPRIEELNELLLLAKKNNLFIYSDEMYHGLVHDKKFEIPSICDIYENSVVLWGMSKSFGLAGLRLGWLCSHRKDILKKTAAFKDYLSICNNAAGEVLAYIAINHHEKFLKPNIKKIVRNKEIFANFCSKYPDLFEFIMPAGGSTIFVKQNTGLSSFDFCDKIVTNTGVMIVPSEMFDFGDNYIRIGLGRENFPEALKIVEEYLIKEKFV